MKTARYSYTNLTKKLKKLGIQKPGKLASLLLRTFHDSSTGSLYASQFYQDDLCSVGSFKSYMKDLIHLEVLIKVDSVNPKDSRYKLGGAIVRYFKRTDVATKSDLDDLRKDLQRQMNEMWDAIRFIEKNMPPVTEYKIKRHLSLLK